MNGFIAFTKKEFTESVRSYRLLIMLAIFAIFGFLGPLTAKFTPQLLAAFAPQLDMNMPEPVALDSWVQFYKNVSSLGFSLMIILFSSILSTEYTKGTLTIMLTKGLSRPAVILAKFTMMACIMTISLWICFGITWGYTAYFWQDTSLQHLFVSALFLWIGGVMYLAVLMLGSVVSKGAFTCILLVLGVTVVFSILGMTPFFEYFNPMLLSTKNIDLINGNILVSDMMVPMIISLAFSAACMIASIIIFNRKQV
ncbi:MAG: ABC transporter permease subunit [Angelakisella sp.]|nr:ABC transporter permease subunit [Angelakisella sp.]